MHICIEGIDGSGKSTQAALLEHYLKEKGKDVLLTQFPSKNLIGTILRNMIEKKIKLPSKKAICMLFVADMYEQYESVIKPAIESGKIVICDRYANSNKAYQAVEGIDRIWIRHLQFYIVPPNVTYFLDVPVDICFDRLNAKKEKYENKEFLEKVSFQYSSYKGEEVFENKVILKGDLTMKETHEAIVADLEGRL